MTSGAGDSSRARERVQAVIDAWNAHDGAAVAETMTEDVVYINLGLGERVEGQAAVREYVNQLEQTFSSDYQFALGLVVGDGESFAAEWTMTGTNDRPNEQRGLPATGQRFSIPGVTVGRVRDGMSTENRVYWNLAAYLRQVGLMSDQAAASAPS